MAKSPKKSRTRKPRTFGQALDSAERKRKPNKALRELMRNKSVWELAPDCPRGFDSMRNVLRNPAAQIENDKLVQQPGAKLSNPKDALGIMKVPASTISAPVVSEVGVAMLEGALKYGRHNYRAIGVRASVYYDAVVARHMALWWEGEDEDADTCELAPEGDDTGLVNGNGQFVVPGTGLSHITKAIAGLCVLRDAMIQNKFIDDRPPHSAKGWQDKYNKMVKALLKKYPTPVPPYIEGDERMK